MGQRQMAVAAHLKNNRKKQYQVGSDHLDEYLQEQTGHAAAYRSHRLHNIYDSKVSESSVAIDNNHSKVKRHERQVDGLMEIVEERLSRANHYTWLSGLSVFFVLYLIVLFMQRDTTLAYSIEASLINSIVAGLPGDGRIVNTDQFYDWMQSDLVGRIFTDPICGDGTCEYPQEYAGFGRFGCEKDCGKYLYTSTVTVDLKPFYNASAGIFPGGDFNQDWELSGKIDDRKLNADFRWNIYSDTMGEFIFAEDQV